MKHLLFFLFLSTSLLAQRHDEFRPDIPHGKLDSLTYPSQTVGKERKVLIYTPPGYSSAEEYPVLYLLHGIGGDEKEWLKGGNPQWIIDNLLADKKALPMLVVMPNGRAMKDDRAVGNIFEKDKVEAFATFEKDLLNDLIPFIEKNYKVSAHRDKRALAGLSMGGGQSLNFGLKNAGTFGWVGAFSPAPNTLQPEELLASNPKVNLLWINCGDADGLLHVSQRTRDYLVEKNIPHVFSLEKGGHDFGIWKSGLYQFAQLIFKP
jgi:enterochelin esterase-like enzyme